MLRAVRCAGKLEDNTDSTGAGHVSTGTGHESTGAGHDSSALGRAAVVCAGARSGRGGAAGEHRLRVRSGGHRLRRDTAGRQLLRAGHAAGPRGVRHEPLFPEQRGSCVRLRVRSHRRRDRC